MLSILYLGSIMGSGYWFYLFLLLLYTIYGLLNYKRLAIAYRRLTQLCLIDFIAEVLTRVSYFYSGSSYPIYYFLIPITIIYHSFIYSTLYKQSFLKKTLRIWASIVLVAYILVALNEKSLFNFPSLGLMILSFSIISISLMSFYDMLIFPSTTSVFKQSLFWVNSANLIFYSTTFFVYGYFYLYKTPQWAYLLIGILNIFLYSCYCLSFYWQVDQFKRVNDRNR